jgi:hypothetical protein
LKVFDQWLLHLDWQGYLQITLGVLPVAFIEALVLIVLIIREGLTKPLGSTPAMGSNHGSSVISQLTVRVLRHLEKESNLSWDALQAP